ncbi:MAG: hypothetical protein IJW55_05920 [Clostridia bacterium]|nr:hypothetical protein [Clostridia bacterium]
MKKLKRISSFLLVIFALFSLFGCNGEYQYAIGGNKNENDTDGGYTPPTLNDDPTDDFTVTVMADGEPYSPRMDMYVYWNDGFSVHTAKLDEQGVARIDGLDGDYKVTLSAVPNEYTYDPNSNLATNDDRNIILDLYTLNHLSGSGTGLYDCYSFTSTGVYSAVIEDADDAIYFQYAPSTSGTYTIESWIDTTEDTVDPYIEVYGGHSQFKYYVRTTYDGGAVGSYTMNFVHTVQIAAENISAGGQATYTFAVRADSKNNQYPVTVTFAVKRNGEFELNSPSKVTSTAVPEFDFSDFVLSDHEYGSDYTLTYPEYRLSEGSNTYVFDEERFQIWEKEKGGDGFYHVYDKEKYASTGGYGPILYANITTACRFIDRAFTEIEYRNGETINAALSVGGVNYKHFIEGYTFLSTYGNINGGSYYCVTECPCHDITVSLEDWACTSECRTCHKDCRRIPAELIDNEGYQAYANADGMVPVTEELQKFLAGYCQKETLFYDGKGTLETSAVNGKYFQAVGDSGWLFACAYYEPN